MRKKSPFTVWPLTGVAGPLPLRARSPPPANAATPAKTVAELVALLKAKPGQSTYGSNGNGTAQHLIGTQFQNLTATELVHVPYKGSGPLATDLLGGQITMSFDTVTPVLPHI